MTENIGVKISSDTKIILDTMYQQLRSSGIKITEKRSLALGIMTRALKGEFGKL